MILPTMHILKKEEGLSLTEYLCPTGYPTIGYGLRTGDELSGLKINEKMAELLLEISIQEFMDQMDTVMYEVLGKLYRQEGPMTHRYPCLVSMAYQLGVRGLMKFEKMLAALARGDWQTAHDECLDSLAARQCPERFKRNANCLLTGIYEGI